jgi:hypothetical protein
MPLGVMLKEISFEGGIMSKATLHASLNKLEINKEINKISKGVYEKCKQ